MALKSSLLWFRRNWRKTSSRFFTSRGPRTIRADFCGDRGRTSAGELPARHGSAWRPEAPGTRAHSRWAALRSSRLRKERDPVFHSATFPLTAHNAIGFMKLYIWGEI